MAAGTNAASIADGRLPAPGAVSQSVPASRFGAPELDTASVVPVIRIGLLLVLAVQLFYAYSDRYMMPDFVRNEVFPVKLAIVVPAAIVFFLTWTKWFRRNWQPAAWVAIAWLIGFSCLLAVKEGQFGMLPDDGTLGLAFTHVISGMEGEYGPLFVTIVTIVLVLFGTGILFPWGRIWQASLEAVGLVALFLASRAIAWPLSGGYEWGAVLVGIGVAQWCHELAVRNRLRIADIMSKLRAAREEAMAATRAKSEFLSSMSHEIRTPMNAVIGMAELLSDTPMTQEQRRYVEIMRANGDALIDLINDILDLAKIESGRLNLEHTSFHLEDTIGKLGEMMGVRADEKELELAIRIAPEVPDELVGDSLRLRQVLVNLFGNAIKFTERGVISLNVERAGEAPGGGIVVRFSVRDTGIGIPKDRQTAIFSSFTQADSSTSRNYGGTGLGLAIVKRLVELYGGEIWVESEPGVGSCFTFTARFGIPTRAETVPAKPVVDLKGVKALVVDETPLNRTAVKEILTAAGANVSEAEDTRWAAGEINRAIEAHDPYRLILTACRTRDADGIDLLSKLRRLDGAAGEPAAVAMLAPGGLTAMPAKLRELGVRAYLVKPIRRAELLDSVRIAVTGADPDSTTREKSATLELPPLKVLLADDSKDNRLLVKAFLANNPVQITEAENGSDAVVAYKNGKFDVVLMDMRMPIMDGRAATKAIRAWELEHDLPRTPIIALTASALDEAVQECIAVGCDLHVSKPVRRLGLLGAISGVVKPRGVPGGEDGKRPVAVIDPELRDLIPGFLQSKRTDVAAVLAALETGDYSLASTVAHQLKGEGGSYGFSAVTDFGRELEDAARDADRERSLQLTRDLVRYLDSVEVTYRG
ncbi:MAG: response regulator [Candidatus Binataceae bacterium]